MFDDRHYVPCLKAKKGEMDALRTLKSTVRTSLTPLIEIPPVPVPAKTRDKPEVKLPKSFGEHLAGFPDMLFNAWKQVSPLLVDTVRLSADLRHPDGTHPLVYLFDHLKQKTLIMIPVTGLERDNAYQSATKDVIKRGSQGACIRIRPDELFDSKLSVLVEGLISFLEIKRSRVDLIFDLRSLAEDQVTTYKNFLVLILNTIPKIDEWRNIVLLSSGFPENLIKFQPNQITPVRRTDWQIWKLIRRSQISRVPTFGDYAIQHPTQSPEVRPNASASIRYTSDDDWYIFRGKSVLGKEGYGQFTEQCKKVIAHDSYCQRTFSWGDEYIRACADGEVSTGNLTTWRQAGTNHHLTFAALQIATLLSTSTPAEQ